MTEEIQVTIKATDSFAANFAAFEKSITLAIYRNVLGFYRFFLMDWWRLKLGLKPRKLPQKYSAAREMMIRDNMYRKSVQAYGRSILMPYLKQFYEDSLTSVPSVAKEKDSDNG